MKKLLTILLLSLLSTSLFAWEYSKEGNTVTIYANAKSTFVSYYQKAPWFDKDEESLNIIFNEGITSIEASAFAGSKNIVSVVIPESCTVIKEAAFANCPNLKEVKIPTNTALEIQDRAFFDCLSLDPVITGPNTKLGKDAFGLTTAKVGTVMSVIKG